LWYDCNTKLERKPMNILFIEDDEDKAKRVIDFVRSDMSDVQVVCARSFNSGLKSLAVGAKRFDLVLLDMTMPRMMLLLLNPRADPSSISPVETFWRK